MGTSKPSTKTELKKKSIRYKQPRDFAHYWSRPGVQLHLKATLCLPFLFWVVFLRDGKR